MVRSAVMQEIENAIAKAGGLHTQRGLAARWGVSKAYVSEAVRHPDFPAPILIDGREHWSGVDADAWRSTPRRPGPVPRARDT